jgi:ABC-type bacteriocin/lantibiotic exporter with double-glycine peptidase domain
MATIMIFINVVFFMSFTSLPLLPTYTVYAIGFYQRLSNSLGFKFTRAFTGVSNLKVSFDRINEFLHLEELVDRREKPADSKTAVQMDNLSFCWSEDDGFGINNLSMKVRKGEFVSIVGPVGSGKVSLL